MGETLKRIDLVPPIRHGGTGAPKIGDAYWQRVSTRAKALDDQTGLIGWKAKMAAKGIATNPDLAARAATLPDGSREWRDLVERACDRAGASAGADLGTSIHAAAELLELGDPQFGDVPVEIRRDAEAFVRTLHAHGLTSVTGELFVACERWEVAGSFDRLCAHESGAYVIDVKTIKQRKDPYDYAVRYSALAWACQVAMYAASQPYDGEQGFLDWAQVGLPVPSQRWGYVAAIPRGSGECRLIRIDLARGAELAELAYRVVKARKFKVAEVVA
jgi:hypothetical protein